MGKQATRVTVNGKSHARIVEARLTLADSAPRAWADRYASRLQHGVCGACTVLVDGRSAALSHVRGAANGREVTTVEGLTPDGGLSASQQAFVDNHGLQCGVCTPGMLITLTELLAQPANPSEQEVRETLTALCAAAPGYGIVAAA